MAQTTIETPPSLPDVLAQNIKFINKGEYELDLPSSFSFGPRIFGGLVMSMTHQAVQNYFTETHSEYSQPDVLSMQWQFFRLLFASIATASGGQAATVQAGLEQKREREMGVAKIVDAESGSYRAPAMIASLATSIEIKKLLPPGGTKWLFMRAQAKEIKNGRLSMEVMVFDEGMELVALSQQLCPIIELSRAMANKQKL
ncbi:hypothetical protein BGAL_0599g00050 [Botrytis galanthina]|uniref:Acyl-CoA thioesterase-like C-terminal domain-containing protein n=1 Tax=Botrytis galanthina TaxID=278940 RepID=A0A4S8QJ49_9HELO|nr:hypothetical protein BGAL_0599g00050 [Botrytis galanthina]